MTLCAVCARVTVEENLPVCGGAAILKQLKSIASDKITEAFQGRNINMEAIYVIMLAAHFLQRKPWTVHSLFDEKLSQLLRLVARVIKWLTKRSFLDPICHGWF